MATALVQGKEKDFVFAGKAVFTLESKVTGKHYTFKVTKAKDRNGLYFASLLTGRDNEQDFTYLGLLTISGLIRTEASRLKAGSTPVLALNYFMKHINNVPKELGVYHEGRCCCCGRPLTTPESIEKGIGPECKKALKLV